MTAVIVRKKISMHLHVERRTEFLRNKPTGKTRFEWILYRYDIGLGKCAANAHGIKDAPKTGQGIRRVQRDMVFRLRFWKISGAKYDDVHFAEGFDRRENALSHVRLLVEKRGFRTYDDKRFRDMIRRMRRAVFSLFNILGFAHIARFFNRNSLTILLYHGVAPKENRGLPAQASIYNYRGKFIEPEHFEHQMQYFARHYHIVGLDEGLRKLTEGKLPKYALAITFDDGYRNFYTYAFPILKKTRIPATMFLATDFVLRKAPLWVDRLEYAGKKSDEFKQLSEKDREEHVAEVERAAGTSFTDFEGDRAVYAPLTLDEIREMRDAGMRFGAHTRSHSILSRIPHERLGDEIAGSKRDLEEALGGVSRAFAYPNGQPGDWNENVESAVRAAGFEAALTTVEGTNTRDTHPMRLQRIAMDGTSADPSFAAIATGMRGYLRRLRSYV